MTKIPKITDDCRAKGLEILVDEPDFSRRTVKIAIRVKNSDQKGSVFICFHENPEFQWVENGSEIPDHCFCEITEELITNTFFDRIKVKKRSTIIKTKKVPVIK